MENVTISSERSVLGGLVQNAAARQILAMVGIAASVALGVAIILWSRTPTYGLLYANMTQEAAAEVVQSLQNAGIPYDLQAGTGAIMVPAKDVAEARMKLAAEGLPAQTDVGLELMQEDPAFGISQFMETKRYHHALEIELGRTITKLKPVRSARVHLGLGKESVFVRDKAPATASVTLDVHPGRMLEPDQVAAIAHMVASSIPQLDTKQVTVIDQFGRLLSSPDDSRDFAMTASQFDLTRKIEANYVHRIETLLAPIIGFGRVRAQVVADVDFTVSEQTEETYDPNRSVVRSEQNEYNERRLDGAEGDIPGALSNQPPVTGRDEPAAESESKPLNVARNSMTNYEVDRTVRHTRRPTGRVQRLSVAVIVDDHQSVNDAGEAQSAPLSETDISEITALVREAVGFDQARGDSIQVVNKSFQTVAPMPDADAPRIWETALFRDLLKQLLGAILVLLVVFKVLKPMSRGVLQASTASLPLPAPDYAALPAGGAGMPTAGMPELAAPERVSTDERISAAKQVAASDPERVANIMKDWVAKDGG